MSEHAMQAALVQWCSWMTNQIPELDLIYANPNGGQRDVRVAVSMKAEGVKAGVWDMFLPVPRHPYHGMYLELKHGRKKLTKQQEAFGKKVQAAGYHCVVVKNDWKKAAEAVLIYLGFSFAEAQKKLANT